MVSRFHHHWHLVAVDCAKRECPEVQQANITFFHPNSDGKDDACRDASVGLPPHSIPHYGERRCWVRGVPLCASVGGSI